MEPNGRKRLGYRHFPFLVPIQSRVRMEPSPRITREDGMVTLQKWPMRLSMATVGGPEDFRLQLPSHLTGFEGRRFWLRGLTGDPGHTNRPLSREADNGRPFV